MQSFKPRYLLILCCLVLGAAAAAPAREGEASPAVRSESPAAADGSGRIIINRIKIVLDEQLVIWDQADAPPSRPEGTMLEPGPVISLLRWSGILPGASLPEARLSEEVGALRAALERSLLYYCVQAYVIPPSKDPTRRTVYIALQKGFSYRFSGGAYWGMFGDDNADGAWLCYRLWAGYNRVGGMIGQGLADISPLFWQTALVYTNNGAERGGSGHFRHDGTWTGSVGTTLRPFTLQLDGRAGFQAWTDGRTSLEFGLGPEIRLMGVSGWGDAATGGFVSGLAAIRSDLGWFGPDQVLAGRLELRTAGSVGLGPFTLAAQLSGGMFLSGVYDGFRFKLGEDPDHGLRAAWNSADLQAAQYVMLNSELCWRALSGPVWLISPATLEPFVFLDLAALGGRAPDWQRAELAGILPASYWDCGIGTRILLGAPVHTDFTFGLGLVPGPDPRWKFVFSVSPGFATGKRQG
jgi:hypothetical protein